MDREFNLGIVLTAVFITLVSSVVYLKLEEMKDPAGLAAGTATPGSEGDHDRKPPPVAKAAGGLAREITQQLVRPIGGDAFRGSWFTTGSPLRATPHEDVMPPPAPIAAAPPAPPGGPPAPTPAEPPAVRPASAMGMEVAKGPPPSSVPPPPSGPADWSPLGPPPTPAAPPAAPAEPPSPPPPSKPVDTVAKNDPPLGGPPVPPPAPPIAPPDMPAPPPAGPPQPTLVTRTEPPPPAPPVPAGPPVEPPSLPPPVAPPIPADPVPPVKPQEANTAPPVPAPPVPDRPVAMPDGPPLPPTAGSLPPPMAPPETPPSPPMAPPEAPPSPPKPDPVPPPPAKPPTQTPSPSRQPNPGQPVRIRPQPDADLPAATEGTPVVRKSEGTASPLGQNTATQVEYFDLKLHRPRAGETYASIAKEQYGSERFEAALAAFNRDRDARLETVAPGRPVYVPPLEQLRRRYGNLIGPDSAAPRSAPAAPSPLSQYTPPSTPPDVVPAGGTVRDSLAKPAGAAAAELPRYRVRTDDSLYLIAKKTLGDGERWRDIWKLNQDLLKGSTQIEIGMVLKLPADAKLAEAP